MSHEDLEPNVDITKPDKDETLICVIRKHPMGILGIYLQIFVAVFLIIVLSVILLPTLVGEDSANSIITGIATIASILGAIFILIVTYIYWQSKIILTDKTITQVIQAGIFNRKISQLSVSNVEDVTSTQKGILSHIFHYGTLVVETAGEQVNFIFRHCPKPNFYAKIILEARQHFIEEESRVQ